jgi:hypothetical protein
MTRLEIKEGFGQTEVDIVDGENNSCDLGQEGRLVIRIGKHRPAGLNVP